MKSVSLTSVHIIVALIIGSGIILTVGLLCGLVARPKNCIDRPAVSTTPSTTVSTAQITGSVTPRETTSKI